MPCKDIGENNEVTWTFTPEDYENGLVPGVYEYTYTVCIDGLSSVCDTTTVEITLIDPCDPPVQIEYQAL